LNRITNKEEVRTWFAETIYDGGILIGLVIDQNKEEVIMITSCSTEPSNTYQYRFRKDVFHEVKNLKLGVFLSKQFTHKEKEGLIEYNCRLQRGTYDIEKIQIKTYPDYFVIYLKFGDADRDLEFRFSSIETCERLALYKKNKEDVKIIDLRTQETIEFDKPFNKKNAT
jgi:hypothetical protein